MMKLRLLSLFCLFFLARASDDAIVMKVTGDNGASVELTWKELGYVPHLYKIYEDRDEALNVEGTFEFDWNTANSPVYTEGSLHHYKPGTSVDKMFYFLKEIAKTYNDAHEIPKPLSTSFDMIKVQDHLARKKLIAEKTEALQKIYTPWAGPIPLSEQATWKAKEDSDENKNGDNKTALKLWWAHYEEKAAKLNAKQVQDEEANGSKVVGKTTAKFCLIEDQLKQFKKTLDKEKIKGSEFEIVNQLSPRNPELNGDYTNTLYEIAKIQEEEINARVIDFFRFEVDGAAEVFKADSGNTDALTSKIVENRQANRESLVNALVKKLEEDPKGRTHQELEAEAVQITMVDVAGAAGHDALTVRDCQLNEEVPAGLLDGQIPREKKVNNPRELLDMIEVANKADFGVLLMFSSAKLASLIRQNDLYRLRAMLGFTPTGDYTWESYAKADGELVIGFHQLVEDNSWFDVDAKTEQYHHTGEDQTRGGGLCSTKFRSTGTQFEAANVKQAAYQMNKPPADATPLTPTEYRAAESKPRALSKDKKNKIAEDKTAGDNKKDYVRFLVQDDNMSGLTDPTQNRLLQNREEDVDQMKDIKANQFDK